MTCGDPTGNITALGLFYISGTMPSSTLVNTEIKLRCPYGFIFADGNYSLISICDATGKWTETLTCTRTLFLII